MIERTGGAAAVDGTIDGQAIALRTRNVRRVRLLLRPELLDLATPVRVTIDGKPAYDGPVQPDPSLFLRTWRETRDPQMAAAAELVLGVKSRAEAASPGATALCSVVITTESTIRKPPASSPGAQRLAQDQRTRGSPPRRGSRTRRCRRCSPAARSGSRRTR